MRQILWLSDILTRQNFLTGIQYLAALNTSEKFRNSKFLNFVFPRISSWITKYKDFSPFHLETLFETNFILHETNLYFTLSIYLNYPRRNLNLPPNCHRYWQIFPQNHGISFFSPWNLIMSSLLRYTQLILRYLHKNSKSNYRWC